MIAPLLAQGHTRLSLAAVALSAVVMLGGAAFCFAKALGVI